MFLTLDLNKKQQIVARFHRSNFNLKEVLRYVLIEEHRKNL